MLKRWFRRWLGVEDAQIPVTRAEWLAYKTEISTLLEAVLDQVELVEHKRRQTTAAAARARRHAPEQEQIDFIDQLPRDQQLAAVRSIAQARNAR